ncbi:hypothetical protein [Actinoplanes sp. NPDC049599]|uniref:hypothetical protein n=1 Tax=Actinoplanes sp. NPDC049599 TaxID=3363903 RepID=UPI0037AE8F7C
MQKDLRYMIRRNQERRDNGEKGPGGVKLPNEFPQLRRAKLDVSIEATALVKKEFGSMAALPFAFRTALRQLAYDVVPNRVAQLIGASGGRESQSEHDEGGQEKRRQRSQQNQRGDGRAAASSAGRVSPAEGPSLDRTLYVAKAVDALARQIPDVQRWLRAEPEALNRTRDLFSVADRVSAEHHSMTAEWMEPRIYGPESYGTEPRNYGRGSYGTQPWNYGRESYGTAPSPDSPDSRRGSPVNFEVADVARSTGLGRAADLPPPTPSPIRRKPVPVAKTVQKRS